MGLYLPEKKNPFGGGKGEGKLCLESGSVVWRGKKNVSKRGMEEGNVP